MNRIGMVPVMQVKCFRQGKEEGKHPAYTLMDVLLFVASLGRNNTFNHAIYG